jgi:hypothetical protein
MMRSAPFRIGCNIDPAAMSVFALFACLVLAVIAMSLWRHLQARRRDAYIRSFTLPPGLFDQLRKRHPRLSLKDCQLVAQGLRQYFLTHLKSGRRQVSMPSQVVDDLWHEFILYTKNYDAFCRKAFGRFFHHTPAIVLGSDRPGNAGLRRCWWHACRDENINPRAPTRLPLLFALDAKLEIPDGFRYFADCEGVRRMGADGKPLAKDAGKGATYCGGDFSSSAFDGGTDGFGDAGSADGGHGSGDGGGGGDGGDGGSGCGGGGCGGGGD